MNPFPFQRPVRPEQIIDRDAEAAQLLEWCHSGMLVRLDAPRRYGKTSLIGKVYADASKQGTAGILIDLKGVLTLADMVGRIRTGFRELEGPFRRAWESAVSGVEASFGVRVPGHGMSGGVKLSGRRRSQSQEDELFALLDLPVKFQADGWRQVIVCFDEFQDVLAVPSADDKLRSAIQHHPDTISYVFAGSEPRLMHTLFADRRRAFWSQAQPLQLAPLDAADCAAYISQRFAETDRDPGDALTPLLITGQGHPQRTMLLAAKLWDQIDPGERATLESWQRALAQAKLQTEPEFEAEWKAAGENQRRVLRAVCLYGGAPFRKDAAAAVGLATGSVDRVVRDLVDQTVLYRVEAGHYEFVDPLYEAYVTDLATESLPREVE